MFFVVKFIFLSLIVPPVFSREQSNQGVSKAEMLKIKERVLNLINRQRRAAGLRPVELDDFASTVAERHCEEMLQAEYASHWNRAGLKPYMRYSQAGGLDAVMENVTALWRGVDFDPESIYRAVEDLHMKMFYEQPPNDYHRKNILQPQHTHVGIGISYNSTGLRFAEEFVAHYIDMQPLPRSAKAGSKIDVKGQLLFDKTDLAYLNLFYEPLPKPLSIDMLNQTRPYTGPYSFPTDKISLWPILPDGYLYEKGGAGVIEYDKDTGKFSCQVSFPRPGIYTIVTWVTYDKNKYPVTTISIKVE